MKTQDSIKELRQSIIDYDKNAKDWKAWGLTVEDLLEDLMICEEIDGNLKVCELKMIWYLRHTDEFDFSRFYYAAKSNYENDLRVKALKKQQNTM